MFTSIGVYILQFNVYGKSSRLILLSQLVFIYYNLKCTPMVPNLYDNRHLDIISDFGLAWLDEQD